MSALRTIYNRTLSEETRFWIYKLRHPRQFQELRERTNHHPKGNFSLKGFVEREAIFVHITKSAGTSIALSLFGALPYHYTAWQYRVIFGRRDFDRCFKFTFVRNPWDRLYSAYSYLKNGGWDEKDKRWAEENLAQIDDFNNFVLEWLTPERLYSHIHFWPQSRFVLDSKGRLLVDYVGYFETIAQDFQYIARQVNPAASLAHTNASPRADYRSVYSADAINRVGQLYEKDVTLFGYEFDGLNRKRVEGSVLIDDV